MQRAKSGIAGSWAKGPAEAWAFAVGLSQGGDREKRMSMLLCDNAVEIALRTYLEMRPSLRGGPPMEWKGDPNFPDLLAGYQRCFDEWPDGVNREELRWLHDIRNQLHHRGNGLAPDAQVLDTYLRAGRALLDHLFGSAAADEAIAAQAVPAPAEPVTAHEDARPAVLQDLDGVIDSLETLIKALPPNTPRSLAIPAGTLEVAQEAEEVMIEFGVEWDGALKETATDYLDWTFGVDELPDSPEETLEVLKRLRYLLLLATS